MLGIQPVGHLPPSTMRAIVKLEGSALVTDPRDPGAPSKYGWTLSTYRSMINNNATIHDIKNLSPESMSRLYYRYFWFPHNLQKLNNKKLADSLFLAIINTSPKVPIRLIQYMTNQYCPLKIVSKGKSKYIYLKLDGIMGSRSIARINDCKYLWPGYPFLLYNEYATSRRYAKVWKWARKGLTKRIFYQLNRGNYMPTRKHDLDKKLEKSQATIKRLDADRKRIQEVQKKLKEDHRVLKKEVKDYKRDMKDNEKRVAHSKKLLKKRGDKY